MICGLIWIFLLTAIDYVVKPNSAQISLKSSSNCICPGRILTYLCTVEGNNGATVWSGTAFDCPEIENQLILLHARRFIDSSYGCNDGSAIARGVSIVENNYTSQVEISIDPTMDGKSVTCLYNNGSSVVVIGYTFISIVKDPYPPPPENDVSIIISDVTKGPLNLTIKWSPVAVDCTAIRYITEFDCGSCPNVIDNTQIVCSDIVLGSQCRFTVQTQVCDSISGNVTTVNLTLKLPGAPKVKVIPIYSYDSRSLSYIQLNYQKPSQEHTNITITVNSEIQLDTTSYSFIFTDNGADDNVTLCGSASVLASTCAMKECLHTFNVSSSSCNSLIHDKIWVNVLATNVIGTRPAYSTAVDVYNVILYVNFDNSYAQVTCKLIPWRRYHLGSIFKCSIIYGIVGDTSMFFITDSTMTDTVVLELSTENNTLFPNVEYQFSVSATYRNSTTVVEGTFMINEAIFTTTVSSPFEFTVSTLVFGAVTGSMGVILIITTTIAAISTTMVCIILCKRKGSTLSTDATEDITCMSMSHISTERNVAYTSVHALQVTQAS